MTDRWEQARLDLEREFGEPISLDALTGPAGSQSATPRLDDAGAPATWLIAQRKAGHRHSIDDVLTAWYALQVSPPVSDHLDLGTGIGTVGLLTLWGLGPQAKLTCIEAQSISYRLLQTNIEANGLWDRVQSFHGDLRELSLNRTFPLITGSPPYFPPGTGVMPQDSQKAHARFELRGDVSHYAQTAASHLDPAGWFVFCFPSPQTRRALDGIANAGLKLVRKRDIIPRETLAPLFTIFACRHPAHANSEPFEDAPLTVRIASGELTNAMTEVRKTFGFHPGTIRQPAPN